jgi:hemerythrin superfamily protein
MNATRSADDANSSGNAIELLIADHENVRRLFDEYEELVDDEADEEDRQALAEEICAMLTVHSMLEQEIIYPSAREAVDDQDQLDEAEVEHQNIDDMVAQIQELDPSDELYDAKVKVLSELVEHHVREEEDELFPKMEASELDLDELGRSLQERRGELLEELGYVEEGESEG